MGDHVPVKADLSDLEEKIRWCRQNDDKCREIGENAKLFYEKYVAREPCLDYVEMVCKQIAKRYVTPPDWWHTPPPERDPPKLRKPDTLCYEDKQSRKNRMCVRCQKSADDEERILEEQKARSEADKKDVKGRKQKLRQRVLARARANAAKKAKK